MEENKVAEEFKHKFGRKVYRMAWVVEFALFSLAMSLAGFNIVFGFTEDDLITGFLLAIGWVILAVIELSTVPMAGALRLTGKKYFSFSLPALFGLWFLAAFTVYEFNEIASEYMTRGAREASVRVESLKEGINNAQGEIDRLRSLRQETDDKLKTVRDELQELVEAENLRFRTALKETDEYYDNLISDAIRSKESSIYNASEKSMLELHEREIQTLLEQREEGDGKLASLRDQLAEENFSKTEQVRNNYNKQLADLDARIQRLEEDETVRVDKAKGGIFRSEQQEVRTIQEDIRRQIAEIEKEKSRIRNEMASKLVFNPENNSEYASLVATIKSINSNIDSRQADVQEIKDRAMQRIESGGLTSTTAVHEENINRVNQDKALAIQNIMKTHEANIADIRDNHQNRYTDIAESGNSEAEIINQIATLNGQIDDKAQEIQELVEKTSHEYEKTMYFRMASWFSSSDTSGFGKLPTRHDYNRSLQLIFGPVGIFFGFAAIALAYVGTGLVYDSEQKNMGVDESEDIWKDKEADFKSQIDELKLRIKNQRALEKQVSTLKSQVDQNEQDLIDARRKVFDAVKQVPQTITLPDNRASEPGESKSSSVEFQK